MENMMLFGVPFFSGTSQQALEEVSRALDHQHASPFIVFSANTEQLMFALHHPSFLRALQQSSLNLPDSIGVIWAGNQLRVAHTPPDRIPGRDFAEKLIPILTQKNRVLFLLGGSGDTAQRAANNLAAQYPHLKIAWSAGARVINQETPTEKAALFEKIRATKPDVIFVAYGAPAQEEWILANKAFLGEVGVKVVMAVGGTLDLLAGNLRRVPQSIEAAHLEWLWRLVQQPWRMKRQLALPQFALEVLRQKNHLQK